ncbi:MAG: hypothetical protein H0X62_16925, partial [Bacteroidetes bacterium]|nr:hypothetical protein [Bacteroidota bacterium]
HMQHLYHTIFLNTNSFYLIHQALYVETLYTFDKNGKVSQALLPKNNFGTRNTLAKINHDEGFEVLHTNGSEGAKDFGYFSSIFNEKGVAINRTEIKPTALKQGTWTFGGKINGDYYLYGTQKGYSEDGGINCLIESLNPDGSKKNTFVYAVKLEDNKFPVPSWQEDGGSIGNHAHIHFSEPENAIYVYGLFQTKKKGNVTGIASTKLLQEGVFIHKVSLDGKVIYQKQHYFKDLNIKVSDLNKEILLEENKYTGVLTLGILEVFNRYTKHKSFVIMIDKKEGNVTEQFTGKDYDDTRTVFKTTANNIKYNSYIKNGQTELSTLYKGFNGRSNIEWVSTFVDATGKIPAKPFYLSHKCFILHGKDGNWIVNFDYSDAKKPVLKIFGAQS